MRKHVSAVVAAALIGLAFPIPDHPTRNVIRFSGRQCLLAGTIAPNLGAKTIRVRRISDGHWLAERQLSADGQYAVALPTESLDDVDAVVIASTATGEVISEHNITFERTDEIPLGEAIAENSPFNPPAPPCSCDQRGLATEINGTSVLSASREAGSDGVSLFDGAILSRFPLLSFDSVGHAIEFTIFHQSLSSYTGLLGPGASHNYNTYVVQESGTTGRIVTPDMRVFPITLETGDIWRLPEGFFARLRRDAARGMWILTHHSGTTFEYVIGNENLPGYLMSIQDTAANRLQLTYDGSGRLSRVTSPTAQTLTLTYNGTGRLSRVADPISRSWSLGYTNGRLTSITSPTTEVTTLAATDVPTSNSLMASLAQRALTVSIAYANASFPNHITSVTDGSNATVMTLRYDLLGRVAGRRIGSAETKFAYDDALFDANGNPLPSASPAPNLKIEPGNRTTRVTDRVGNVLDVEMHGLAGGPISGLGKMGVRRTVQWTERGLGRTPLRTSEPRFFEQRWLHDSDSLTPKQVADAFRDDAQPAFDALKMPVNWPTEYYTYNQFRQVTTHVLTNGAESLKAERTYQPFDPANGKFSRLLTATPPRAAAASPIDAGLSFTTTYEHDDRGYLTRILHPSVTRGQATTQVVQEVMVRNARGQVIAHENPDGDITTFDYFTSSTPSTSINHTGAWIGYLNIVTQGVAGSRQTATSRRTTYAVNNLGMVTRTTDAANGTWINTYTTLGQLTRETTPATQFGTTSLSLQRAYHYDRSGHRSIERSINFEPNGTSRANAWIDTVYHRDVRGNVTAIRREVDNDPTRDLISRYAYDGNESLIAVMQPAGNRMFRTYDERRLPLREFQGLGGAATLLASYPARSAATLAIPTLSSHEITYDTARRPTSVVNGRGYVSRTFYDLAGRTVAVRDPNGNGVRNTFDATGNLLTVAAGTIDSTGAISQVTRRQYGRYDELDRPYLEVLDSDIATDETAAVDPTRTGSRLATITFSADGKVLSRRGPLGDQATTTYDASGNALVETDALGNRVERVYDSLDRATEIRIVDIDGLNPTRPVTSVLGLAIDALGNVRQVDLKGRVGAFQNTKRSFGYDSLGVRRVMTDEEGLVREMARDDLLRQTSILTKRGAAVVERMDRTWDVNSRLASETDFTAAGAGTGAITKRFAWDALDRQIRRVDSDSDDPIDGSSNGPDGVFDRIEWTWDTASNITSMTDERGYRNTATYDPGNRVTSRDITVSTGTRVGVSREEYEYDSLNRPWRKSNNFARIERTFDVLGEIRTEQHSVRLDGTGFTRGWIEPITMQIDRDPAGNMTYWSVGTSDALDLETTTAFDLLSRPLTIDATMMSRSRAHRIASYVYEGQQRHRRITYGNGMVWTAEFDALNRVSTSTFTSSTNQLLVGLQLNFDQVLNPLWQRVMHDGNRYDNFGYGAAHQLTGAQYRAATAVDYRTQTPTWSSTWNSDNRSNRVNSSEVDAFGGASTGNNMSYTTDVATQYSQVTLAGTAQTLTFDRAGCAVRLPVYPRLGASSAVTMADATYDVHAQLATLTVNGTTHHYVYDPEMRRIATFTLNGTNVASGRRIVYLGPNEAVERLLIVGAPIGDATSRTERVHVHGHSTDQLLFTAVDGDADGAIGALDTDPYATRTPLDNDFAFYHARGIAGSTLALVHADDSLRVLEYYSITPFGETTVLPPVDADTDGREDTPDDLSDNYAQIPGMRTALGEPSIGRWSRVGNAFTFARRRLDAESGHIHMRARQYDPVLGRFTTRDWAQDISPDRHGFAYGLNRPGTYVDPLGLSSKLDWKVTFAIKDIATLRCPDETKVEIAVGLKAAGELETIPLIFGLTCVIEASVEGELTAAGVRCKNPYCIRIAPPISGSVAASISVSAGYSVGDYFRVEVGARSSGAVDADWDPCKGTLDYKFGMVVSIFGGITVSAGSWWEFSIELSFDVPAQWSGSTTTPKFDWCKPCPCCSWLQNGPQASITTHSGSSPPVSTPTTGVRWPSTSAVASAVDVTTSASSMRERTSVWTEALCGKTCCQ